MNLTVVVVAAALVLVMGCAAVASAAPIPVTVCLPVGSPALYHIMYLPQYYTWQNIAPTMKVIGFLETPSSTPRGMTLSLAQNGTDCYVYFGPSTSGMAQAVNAVMNSVWMAYSVTATEFSDRINYPLFNRAVPRVDVNQRAIASMMIALKWTNVNILCSDNAYGQAAAAALSSLIVQAGGTAIPKCIATSTSYSDTATIVANFLQSQSRVIFIAAGPNEAAYNSGIQAINTLDVNRRLIVIFAEPPCSSGDNTWKTVPGAFCTTFNADPTTYAPFYSAFLTRDTKPEKAALAATGVPYPATANAQGGYAALGTDGARLVLNALDQYVGIYGKMPPSIAAAIAYVRNQTLPDGFTGPIEIPAGDRVRPALMKVFNSIPGNASVVVANISAQGNLSMAASMFVVGQQLSIASIPPAVDPVPPAEAAQPYWVIAIVGGVLIIIAVPAAYVARQKQLLAVRPMDPAAPFAVMFVGVKNVDEVRDAGDANSAAAFAQVANDLRAAVRASGCYEARRVDESTVMVVAKKVDNVLQCASQLMTSMDRVDWRAVMCHANEMVVIAQARRERSATDTRSRLSRSRATMSMTDQRQSRPIATRDDDENTTDSRTKSKKSGYTRHSTNIAGGSAPRVLVGIHHGFGMIDHDDSLNTVSYVGKVVSRAAEVADVAVAGQILVSREAQDAAEAELVSGGTSWNNAGAFERLAAWDSVAPDTSTFIPKGQPEEVILHMRAAAKNAVDAAQKAGRVGATGTIAAALQRAEAGLSQRRIGALSIHVPALRDLSADPSKVTVVADLIEEITGIAAVHRGEVHAMVDGTILVTVNAGTPAAQPVARAALIAIEVMSFLESQHMDASAGIAGGISLVGRPSQGAAFAAFGQAAHLASLAQQLAQAHGLKVCAIDTNAYDDLAGRLHVATIDIVPSNCRDGVSRVIAIIGERDATGGEWLYSVGNSNAGLSANEHVWEQICQLQAASPEALAMIDAEVTSNLSPVWRCVLGASATNLRAIEPLLSPLADGSSPQRDAVVDGIAKLAVPKLQSLIRLS